MNNKSFTLIELLVVIVIIGILAGVIMISTSSSIDKANIAKSKVFAESVKNSLMLNLVSEWKFDENSGTQIKDSWESSANGTFGCYGTGCQNPEWITSNCISNACIKFHCLRNYSDVGGPAGSHIMITQNNSINLTSNQPFTIEYWINLSNFTTDFFTPIMKGNFATSYGHLINDRILHIYTDDDTSPEFSISNFFSSNETNTWIHVVQTFYNTKIVAYKNSQTNPTYESTSGITLSTNTFPLWFGANNGVQYFLNGLLDDVRIYNSALSSSQIKQNYIAGLDSLLSKGSISKEEYNKRLSQLSQKIY